MQGLIDQGSCAHLARYDRGRDGFAFLTDNCCTTGVQMVAFFASFSSYEPDMCVLRVICNVSSLLEIFIFLLRDLIRLF